ncbi:MAG TPA: PQQ-binding-like beta-propeller repeat protein [Steroidobacter sp.]|jgi:quinoprotein glucose dehydrogenase|nr:PQQ-binding-like beta-propeller repeat protein [Steroidobacter sp.]
MLGSTRDMAPWFLPSRTIGMPNMGPIVTAGGLIFIGAATDNYLRAFDLDSVGVNSGRAPCPRVARRRQ